MPFCNEFPHLVYVAIAYEQSGGSFISRGWLSLDTGDCSVFDSAILVKTFYYRGESVPCRAGRNRVKMSRGGDKDFAIWERDNFHYYDAEKRVLKSSLASFTKGPETIGDGITATVTFLAEGGSRMTVPAPSHPAPEGSGGGSEGSSRSEEKFGAPN